MARCRKAITLGTISTRCMEDAGQTHPHMGKGLAQFPYQRIEFFDGDRRIFETDRDDEYAWEDSP